MDRKEIEQTLDRLVRAAPNAVNGQLLRASADVIKKQEIEIQRLTEQNRLLAMDKIELRGRLSAAGLDDTLKERTE
ncbi:MAG: hypothetical protein HRU18_06465 [Pseudoalteromonas sp.]|uniref:hypothetical protein n=1 Tax=Pseudoalteromonas sp. TaxID=53249 RepID=UPI001D63E566|nr:hypothetical protein [Pseudoalteromonas sp.]NRA77833.1 hypothetical protein [Pseudoalteromonas sp.]